MNVELLKKVKQHILADARRYDQNTWTVLANKDNPDSPPCGTIACIGGWACHLSQQPVSMSNAAFALGLNDDQAGRLFSGVYLIDGSADSAWPLKFAEKFVRARTANGKAKVAAERIAHFIKTKGLE